MKNIILNTALPKIKLIVILILVVFAPTVKAQMNSASFVVEDFATNDTNICMYMYSNTDTIFPSMVGDFLIFENFYYQYTFKIEAQEFSLSIDSIGQFINSERGNITIEADSVASDSCIYLIINPTLDYIESLKLKDDCSYYHKIYINNYVNNRYSKKYLTYAEYIKRKYKCKKASKKNSLCK